MRKLLKRITLTASLLLCFNAFLFSEEQETTDNTESVETIENNEKKSTLKLGKDVAELKYELYKIENKLGEYEDVSDFDLSLIKAKKERLLRKRNQELLEAVDNNKAKAKEILEKAAKGITSKAQELKDFLEYIKDYFE